MVAFAWAKLLENMQFPIPSVIEKSPEIVIALQIEVFGRLQIELMFETLVLNKCSFFKL